MSEASRPKVYLCAPAELSAKSMAAFRKDLGKTGGFEIFPRPDLILPGQNFKKILDRQLHTADVYLVLKFSDGHQTWDSDVLMYLKALSDQEIPRILPVIEEPASNRGMHQFLAELQPVRVAIATFSREELTFGERHLRALAIQDLVKAIQNVMSLRRRTAAGNDGGRGYFAEIEIGRAHV